MRGRRGRSARLWLGMAGKRYALTERAHADRPPLGRVRVLRSNGLGRQRLRGPHLRLLPLLLCLLPLLLRLLRLLGREWGAGRRGGLRGSRGLRPRRGGRGLCGGTGLFVVASLCGVVGLSGAVGLYRSSGAGGVVGAGPGLGTRRYRRAQGRGVLCGRPGMWYGAGGGLWWQLRVLGRGLGARGPRLRGHGLLPRRGLPWGGHVGGALCQDWLGRDDRVRRDGDRELGGDGHTVNTLRGHGLLGGYRTWDPLSGGLLPGTPRPPLSDCVPLPCSFLPRHGRLCGGHLRRNA